MCQRDWKKQEHTIAIKVCIHYHTCTRVTWENLRWSGQAKSYSNILLIAMGMRGNTKFYVGYSSEASKNLLTDCLPAEVVQHHVFSLT